MRSKMNAFQLVMQNMCTSLTHGFSVFFLNEILQAGNILIVQKVKGVFMQPALIYFMDE